MTIHRNQGTVSVNGREYDQPAVPAVVVCLDGCEPAYLDAAIAAGLMPALEKILETGTSRIAHAAMPSFTNPNNLSIATGRPPAVHGICGNYLFDTRTEQEVMMNDASFLRAPTIFSAFQGTGARVALITAKDKLRALLGAGLEFGDGGAICISAERASGTTSETHGIVNASRWLGRPEPDVYSAALSEFVFAAGVKLLLEWKPDILYLTTTDYIQHTHPPGSSVANDFYAMFDRYLKSMDETGAAVVVTADHGMNDKHKPDGSPDVVYLQTVLDDMLGTVAARVILPITDPYVVHHGALGSFATAYLPADASPSYVIDRLQSIAGIEAVLSRTEAAARFELPADRIGDLVVLAARHVVLGTTRERHDLNMLEAPLRSHGGLSEQCVPFIVNRVMDLPDAPDLRNFDAFFHAVAAAGIAV